MPPEKPNLASDQAVDGVNGPVGGLPAAVLWDLDGTLVDTEPYWFAAEFELVESFGGHWSMEHAHALVGADLYRSAQYIRDNTPVPLPDGELIQRLLDVVVRQIHAHVPWRPGAAELLAELGRLGVPCAIVTMSWQSVADAIVQTAPAGSFQAVITGDQVTHGKPHPEPYLTAAARLGVAAGDCVAFEDSPSGMRSAFDAGCRTVVVPNVVPVEIPPGVVELPTLAGLPAQNLMRLHP